MMTLSLVMATTTATTTATAAVRGGGGDDGAWPYLSDTCGGDMSGHPTQRILSGAGSS